LKTEVDSRDSDRGQGRIKAARFPARKTLEEFDFAFQTSIRREQVLHLGQTPYGDDRVIAPICASGPVGSGRLQWPGEMI
jgi:DNA replication protein DnaC